MPNLIQREMASDAVEMMSDLGTLIAWKGNTYPAIVSAPSPTLDLEVGGMSVENTLQVRILRTAFSGATPTSGDLITYDGRAYLVSVARQRAGDAFFYMEIAENL